MKRRRTDPNVWPANAFEPLGRVEGGSFARYKQRRAALNEATRRINEQAPRKPYDWGRK